VTEVVDIIELIQGSMTVKEKVVYAYYYPIEVVPVTVIEY
jgi:hypothetical protein